jgi:hypothetical protein
MPKAIFLGLTLIIAATSAAIAANGRDHNGNGQRQRCGYEYVRPNGPCNRVCTQYYPPRSTNAGSCMNYELQCPQEHQEWVCR